MVWVQIIAIIVSVGVVVALIIYNLVKSGEEKQLKEVDENPPRVKIFGRTAFTNGYHEGFLTKDIPRKNGCHLIEFYPSDFKNKKDKKRPAIQSVVVNEAYLKHMPRGTISSETEQVWALPSDKVDLPKELRDTFLGKAIEEESENAFVERTFGNRRKRTLQAVTKALEDSTEVLFSEKWLAEFMERINNERKIASSLTQKDDEKK